MNSLNNYARSAGVLYILITLLAPFSMIYMPATLVVPGDAAATATHLATGTGLLRAAMVSDALVFLLEIGLTVVLYALLKPVNAMLSLMAAFARLAMTIVQGINLAMYGAVLLLVSGDRYLTAFAPAQVQALTLFMFNLHGSVVLIWGLFFALHLLLLGYLVYQAGYLPRFVGVLLFIVAACYFTQSFGTLLLPQYQAQWATVGLLASIEIVFPLWLLIRGVKAPQAV